MLLAALGFWLYRNSAVYSGFIFTFDYPMFYRTTERERERERERGGEDGLDRGYDRFSSGLLSINLYTSVSTGICAIYGIPMRSSLQVQQDHFAIALSRKMLYTAPCHFTWMYPGYACFLVIIRTILCTDLSRTIKRYFSDHIRGQQINIPHSRINVKQHGATYSPV